jgi:hypothetical protein
VEIAILGIWQGSPSALTSEMRTARYKERGDMKSETKIKTVMAAILIVATFVSVSALVSAVQKADNGTTLPAMNGTNPKN